MLSRAQTYQLLKNPEAALADINQAIELAGRNREVLRNAYAQRGAIHKAQERTELARKDFEFAAKLGSTFAKVEAVALNPYAALCNQFLTQALREHQAALPEDWKPAADAVCQLGQQREAMRCRKLPACHEDGQTENQDGGDGGASERQ